MLCKKPFIRSGSLLAFGCGQCLPCRINKRREWTSRMMLEACCHAESSFVTLTYSPEKLPKGDTLVPADLRNFLKRLRKNVEPAQIRYFGVGEYGELSQRPHYHLAIFGLGRGADELIRRSWGLGFTDVGDLTLASAQYIAGYVTKKMTKKDDARLGGRFPEFARMSNRPGIGALAVDNIIDALLTDGGAEKIAREGDVPLALMQEKRSLPLGRYLRRKLRERYGFEEIGTPKEKLKERMQELSEEYVAFTADPANRSKTFKKMLLEKNEQDVLRLETRTKIFSKKGAL